MLKYGKNIDIYFIKICVLMFVFNNFYVHAYVNIYLV